MRGLFQKVSKEGLIVEKNYRNQKYPTEIIELRKANGIPYWKFYYRIKKQGMTLHEAATKPIEDNHDPEYRKWVKVAKANGISQPTFHSRVFQMGWSYEKASSEPLRKQHLDKWLEKARDNGINYRTFISRIKNGWDKERASTEPTRPSRRKKIIYAIYKGDEYITDGTKDECAEVLGVTPDTITFYASPTYKQRAKDRGKTNNWTVAEKLGVEDD